MVDPDRGGYPDFAARGRLAIRVTLAAYLDMNAGLNAATIADLTAIGEGARSELEKSYRLFDTLIEIGSEVKTEIRRERARIERTRPGANLDQVEKLLAALGNLDCTKCVHNSNTSGVCQNKLVADQKVVEHPLSRVSCLTFASEMFEKLVAEAGTYYRSLFTAAGASAANGGMALIFKLRLSPSYENALGGYTLFLGGDSDSARRCEVTLTLPIHHFGHRDLGALPYVMFHEIFVHGPEAWPTSGNRQPTATTCKMREGFVDAAAAYYLTELLRRRGLVFSSLPDLSGMLAGRVMQAHFARMNPPEAPGMLPADLADQRYRTTIREEGAGVFSSFASRNLSKTACALACALNLLETTPDQREQYMVIISGAVDYMMPDDIHLGSRQHRLAAQLRQIVDRRPIDLGRLQRLLDSHLAVDPRFSLDLDF